MEAPHEQDMPPIDKYWPEASGLTIWEAAYWVEIGGDPRGHENRCNQDDAYDSHFQDHPGGAEAVYEKCEVIKLAIHAGLIKTIRDIRKNNGDFDPHRTYILKSDWLNWCRQNRYSELAKRFDPYKDDVHMTLIAASSEYLLEAKIQEKNDAKARIRESEQPERMHLLAGKKHLGLADWIEITGMGVADESHYKISKEGIRFIGWDEEAICSSPSDDQPNLIRQNEEPGLVFPCTPKELLDFVDSGTGSMFGSFFVPDEFRRTVIQIEQTPAHVAKLGRAGLTLTASTEIMANPAGNTEAWPAPAKKINKLRRNILDPAIDKAIEQAGNRKLADVYLRLKVLALAEEPPFKGTFEGDAMCYTDSNDKDAKLSKGALGKRLKRRR